MSVTTSEAHGNFDQRLASLASLVDDWMRDSVRPPSGLVAPLYDMMAYHLGWIAADGSALGDRSASGKRLRPILAILTCEALGGTAEMARGPAVAVELVHNFSLVHDDIQDRSDFRHGRETVWRLWGVAQAINVGDGLFSLAQLALAEQMSGRARLSAAVQWLNRTGARLVEGQFLDLHLERTVGVPLETYERMIAGKTAALTECSCALGALAAEATEVEVTGCAQLGRVLGMAFQLQDDLLGAWGDPGMTGKPSGEDVRSRKKSLPVVLGLNLATGAGRDRLAAIMSVDRPLDDEELAEALGLLEMIGVRDRAAKMVEERFLAVEEALAAALPAGRRGPVEELCGRLRTRSN